MPRIPRDKQGDHGQRGGQPRSHARLTQVGKGTGLYFGVIHTERAGSYIIELVQNDTAMVSDAHLAPFSFVGGDADAAL